MVTGAVAVPRTGAPAMSTSARNGGGASRRTSTFAAVRRPSTSAVPQRVDLLLLQELANLRPQLHDVAADARPVGLDERVDLGFGDRAGLAGDLGLLERGDRQAATRRFRFEESRRDQRVDLLLAELVQLFLEPRDLEPGRLADVGLGDRRAVDRGEHRRRT